ncbi:MAG TPA: cytochrome c-type protein NapC [Leucothrix sp.]|nr:cytochrome c-type protein NapC [Leucothrix sp.]
MFKKIIGWLKKRAVLTVVFIGFIGGVIFWGGFNTALEVTNTESFCISCHEMKDNVYQEYRQTIHYQNRTGVRATCPDCHVPKDWTHKIVRKIEASREVYHKILGTVSTPKKFDDYRLTMAKSEWRRMKKTDSRECRNCHEFESMDYSMQSRRAVPQHIEGFDEGKTCIDCHKGIAHKMPNTHQLTDEEKKEFSID